MTTKTPALKKLITADNAKEERKLIDAAIASIANRGKRLDRDIWIAAASAIAHHAKHGNYERINHLIAAMPKGSRVNALREYIETFSGCVYDEEAKAFVHSKGKKARVEDAMKTAWWDFKPEQPYQPISDPAKMLSQLVKRMETDREKMGAASKVSPEMLKAAQTFASQYVH